MKRLWALLALALYAASISNLWAATKKDPFVAKVEQFKAERAAVFVADCQYNKAKYVLMFRVGDTRGGYAVIERAKHGPVSLDLGEIDVKNGRAQPGWRTGGVVSGPAQTETMKYLLTLPFHLLSSDQLDSIYNTPSKRRCDFGK